MTRCGRFPDPELLPEWVAGTFIATCCEEAGHPPPHRAMMRDADGLERVYEWPDPQGVEEANRLEGVTARAERVPDWEWPRRDAGPSFVVERYGGTFAMTRISRWRWWWLCVKHPRAWWRGRRGLT